MSDGVESRQKTLVGTPAELAAAREARGMSQLDISQRIKLQVRQVNALEEGQWDALPGKSFVRGALRSYGKLLDVDVAPLLESIGGFAEPAQVQGMQPLETPISRSSSGMGFNGGGRGSPILWVIAGLIGVVALVLYFGSDQDSARIRSWLPSGQSPAGSTTEPAPPATPSDGSPAPAGNGGTSSTGPGTSSAGTPEPAAGNSGVDAVGTPGRAAADSAADAGGATQQPAWGALQDLPQVSPSTTPPSPIADASPSGAAGASAGSAGTTAAGSTSPSGSVAHNRRGAEGMASPVATQVAAQVAAPPAAPPAAPATAPATAPPAAPATAPVTPPATAPAANGSKAAAGMAAGEPAPLAVAPATSAGGSTAGEAAAANGADPADATGLVRIKAQEDAWVEVRQADGTSLHNGLVKAGASIDLKGTPPYRVVLGNASEVELAYEGKVQDLKAHIRANNIARLQLR